MKDVTSFDKAVESKLVGGDSGEARLLVFNNWGKYDPNALEGISMKDAEAMANQLKEKGFAEAKALNTAGKVRVSIRSFDNREEATKQLLELRKNETYKNAWLLAK